MPVAGKRGSRRRAAVTAVLCVAVISSGCATIPYRYGHDIESARTLPLKPGEPQVEVGKPNRIVDTIGWILGIPSKIILLNSHVDNHAISTQTIAALITYLRKNDLHNVKVRINQYEPRAEWSRLMRNKAVAFGWRFTIGLLSMLRYTILPGRLFGGDNYNPFTNTINIYSDLACIALHEGGHAKDFAPRRFKGTYAVLYVLPFFALYPEARATRDALGYIRAENCLADGRQAYQILYPAYATYAGGSMSTYVFPYWWVYFAAVIPGHALGRWKASTLRDSDFPGCRTNAPSANPLPVKTPPQETKPPEPDMTPDASASPRRHDFHGQPPVGHVSSNPMKISETNSIPRM